MSSSDSDWLASDGEGEPSSAHPAVEMGSRDRLKAERLFETDGWREGVSAGTADALQPAFNDAFNTIGAPFGRRVGRARGKVDALARILVAMQTRLEPSSPSVPGTPACPSSRPENPAVGAPPASPNYQTTGRQGTSTSSSMHRSGTHIYPAWQSQIAMLNALAAQLEKLDWKQFSLPIVDPHKEGDHGDHNNPPPNVGQQEKVQPPEPDSEEVQRVNQARDVLTTLEQRIAQAEDDTLRLITGQSSDLTNDAATTTTEPTPSLGGVPLEEEPPSGANTRIRVRSRGGESAASRRLPLHHRTGDSEGSPAW